MWTRRKGSGCRVNSQIASGALKTLQLIQPIPEMPAVRAQSVQPDMVRNYGERRDLTSETYWRGTPVISICDYWLDTRAPYLENGFFVHYTWDEYEAFKRGGHNAYCRARQWC